MRFSLPQNAPAQGRDILFLTVSLRQAFLA